MIEGTWLFKLRELNAIFSITRRNTDAHLLNIAPSPENPYKPRLDVNKLSPHRGESDESIRGIAHLREAIGMHSRLPQDLPPIRLDIAVQGCACLEGEWRVCGSFGFRVGVCLFVCSLMQ